MTDKEKLFADEYLCNLNAVQAAINAGYSEKTALSAHKWINKENPKKPYILEYIQKRLDEKEEGLIATQDEILRQLTSTLRREETETVVVVTKKRKSYYDSNGKKVIEEAEEPMAVTIPAKLSDVNRAAELLGKYYTLWTERTQIESGVVQIVNDIPRDVSE